MSYTKLFEAFDIINNNLKTGHVSGPKNELLVNKAEEIINLSYPLSYREFLMKYGSGGVLGIEIYGLTKDFQEDNIGFGVPNGIWMTLNARSEYGLPEKFIIIASTGDGFWYALDSSKPNAEGEYPVVICGFGENNEKSEKVNEDFGEFLLEQVKQALEDD